MKKGIFFKSLLFSTILVLAFTFMSFSTFADELETPEDEIIDEDYVVTTNYYYYSGTHYINSGTYFQNYYDDTYLYSTDLEEFEEYVQDYGSVTVNITLSITRGSDNNSSKGYIGAKNWHTNSNCYDEKQFNISTGTQNYYFTFICDLSHMSNSLCFCYRATDNSWFSSDTWVYNSVEMNFYYNTYTFGSSGEFI